MKIDAVSSSVGGPTESPKQEWYIRTRAVEPPSTFLRQEFYLRFGTAGVADGIGIDADTTKLTAEFRSYRYNALPLAELSVGKSGAVIVTLGAPRKVRTVNLSAGSAGVMLGLYRVDGDTPAETATVTATITSGYALSEAVEASLLEEMAEHPVITPRILSATPGELFEQIPSEEAFSLYDTGKRAQIPDDPGFSDGRFAIRLESGDPLNPSDVTGVQVCSYPTGPRLGIADPDDLASAVFFWQLPGEIRDPVSVEPDGMSAGEALAQALQRYLDDLFANLLTRVDERGNPLPPPQHVDVAFVVVSDAPCTLEMDTFEITYHLINESFPDKQEKHVLRFSGERLDTQETLIQLPGDAIVTSSELELIASFRGDHRLLSSGQNGLLEGVLAQQTGVHLGVDRWAAQTVIPAEAVSASGIALGLMATAAKTELLVELQEDWHGWPSGRKLVRGTVNLPKVGRRSWFTLLFPEAIILPSQPHWLLVKATQGHAVWLAETGSAPVRVLKPSGQATWTEISILDGLQALYRFFSRSTYDQGVEQAPPLTLTIGDQVVAPTPPPDDAGTSNNGDTLRFDLTSALNAYLTVLNSPATAVTIPLTFTAALPGIVTVYPPRIKYDIA